LEGQGQLDVGQQDAIAQRAEADARRAVQQMSPEQIQRAAL
jgi:hypothetical protein